MTAITREFRLYTNAGLSIPPVIHVNQYDQGETWNFKLYQPNGQQFIPTDAAIVGVKADGNIIANAGTVSGGVVIITETEQMTAAPGKAVFEILFDGDTHGTANFVVLVEPSPTNDGIASESDLSLFQEAIDSISPATINAAVSAWMSAQLTPSQWVIDNSLTVANAAADAKAAGDLIRQNTADIGDLTELVTEDQSSLVGAINETRTDLYNWFTDDIKKVKYIYEGSGSDADIYEVQRLEWAAADDADITGLKVITRKEGTSTDTSKFFVDGNELMEYVIGDTSDLSGTITEEISDLKSAIDQLEAIPWAVKQAMDSLFAKSAYADDDVSSDYAVFHAWANAVNLLSISAVYTQSRPVDVTDSLEDLRPDLVVTANYDNGSSVNVTNYVLSGTLEVGTSVITVTFEGKTTTFNVNVTQYWTWNYKASDGLKLSERTDLFNVTYTEGTETIEDGLLHVNINTGATATVNRYEFKSPITNINAILETRVKFSVIPVATDSVAFTPMLSNGTGGAKIGQYRTSTSASPVFATHIGNAKTEHPLTLDTWYTIRLVLENGTQSVYLNDVALIENVGLSTYYCTSNRINFQKTGNTATAPLEMYVDYIRYKNNDL